MIEDIPKESDALFKREILILEEVFEIVSERSIIFDKLPHYRENPFECTDLGEIAINISLVRMLVERGQEVLDK